MKKKMFLRQVDVFAAYVAYTDYEIGRVIDEIEKEGKLDNTLIIYINGDNGQGSKTELKGNLSEPRRASPQDISAGSATFIIERRATRS